MACHIALASLKVRPRKPSFHRLQRIVWSCTLDGIGLDLIVDLWGVRFDPRRGAILRVSDER